MATPEGSPSPSLPVPEGTPDDTPGEIRIAYINLMSPIVLDETDPVASETFEQRLGMVIEELQSLRPDIVAVNEATWTEEHGSAWARLAAGLGMEGSSFARATPWFPGLTEEESRELREIAGFEEGEYLLVRSPYAILRSERKTLNPRVSESEARAALHVVVRGPGRLGEFDVYVTRLAGSEAVRAAQARDLLSWVDETRGDGPVLIFAGLDAEPDSPVVRIFLERGYVDLAAAQPASLTCCRPTVRSAEPLPPPDRRSEYVFSDRWVAISAQPFADEPKELEDGSLLYASDHNGIFLVVPYAPEPDVGGAED